MEHRDKPIEYDKLISSLEVAGFFTTFMGFDHDSDDVSSSNSPVRLIAASERMGDAGVSGRSFWILCCRSRWVLGTWGAAVYEVPAKLIEPLTIAWMRRLVMSPKSKTGTTLDGDLIAEFAVHELDEEEVNALIS